MPHLIIEIARAVLERQMLSMPIEKDSNGFPYSKVRKATRAIGKFRPAVRVLWYPRGACRFVVCMA